MRAREAKWRSGVAAVFRVCLTKIVSNIHLDITDTTTFEELYIIRMLDLVHEAPFVSVVFFSRSDYD